MRTHVILPDEMVDEIDELVGKRKRSQFVKDAVAERLRREQRLKAFDDVVGSLKDSHIPEWDTPESSAAWVREQRRESDRIRGVEIEIEEDGTWNGFSWTPRS